MEALRHQGAGGIDRQGLGGTAVAVLEVDLELDRREIRDLQALQAWDPLPQESPRADRYQLLGPAAGHLVLQQEVYLPRQELPAQLDRQIVGGASGDQSAQGFPVEADHHHLGPAVLEQAAPTDRLDDEVGAVAVEDQAVRLLAGDGAAHLQGLAEAPETEETDAVLPLGHEPQALLGGEGTLAAVADVGGDVAQGFGTVELRDHPLAVVEDPEAGDLPLAHPGDADRTGARVQAVLHQLRQGLARVGLGEGEPADELERVVDLDLAAHHVLVPAPLAPAALPAARSLGCLGALGGRVAEEVRWSFRHGRQGSTASRAGEGLPAPPRGRTGPCQSLS